MRLYGNLRLSALRYAPLIFVLVLSSCGWLIRSDDERSVALGGYDPVGYFTVGMPMPGRAVLQAEHEGVFYRFANETNRRLFITNPEHYVPQFKGMCANGMVYALPADGAPDAFKIIDGRLYLFADRRAKQYFEMDQDRNLRLARHYWDSEVKDASLWLQLLKRQVFRVPHYKSNEELAAEYQRRLAGKSG